MARKLRYFSKYFSNISELSFFIYGVEVTQVTQYWQSASHLSNPESRDPDNSMPLVADKPALVRVYIGRLVGGLLSGVTGTIKLQRRRNGVWRDFDSIVPYPYSMVVELNIKFDVFRSRGALNFIIPSAYMRGTMRLKVRVEVPGSEYAAEEDVVINISILQTLRICVIPWGHVDFKDFLSTVSKAIRMFPVSDIPVLRFAPEYAGTKNLLEEAGWLALLGKIRDFKILEGNRIDTMYYCLIGKGRSGIYSGLSLYYPESNVSVGASFVGNDDVMAQEMGHMLGLEHPSCATNGDKKYPDYGPYAAGSIGEYGVDMAGMLNLKRPFSIMHPGAIGDFMGYSHCRGWLDWWISPYHYEKLIFHPALSPQWVPLDVGSLPPYIFQPDLFPIHDHTSNAAPKSLERGALLFEQPDALPCIVFSGWLSGGKFDFRSVLRVRTATIPSGQPIPSFAVELLDEQGNIIQRAPLVRIVASFSSEGMTGEPVICHVEALIPDHSEAKEIRVMHEDCELWSRKETSVVPRISDVSAKLEKENLMVCWHAEFSDEYFSERVVRYSGDGGLSWNVLAVGLIDDEVTIPISGLSSGSALVEVLFSDGFYTVASEPIRVEVPSRPPQVAILWPDAGATYESGTRIRCLGMANASDGRALSGEELHWEIDGEMCSAGVEAWVSLLEREGEHKLVLRALDGNNIGEISITFYTVRSG